MPLTAGLLLSHPALLLTSYLAGGGGVLLAHRKQPPLKLAFNVSVFAFTTAIAVISYGAIAGGASVLDARAWLAVGAATSLAGLLSALLVFAVMSMASGRAHLADLRATLVFGSITTLGATSVGLAGAILGYVAPAAIVFATAPLIGLYFANRAYVAERERRENLQLLYEASRVLSENVETDGALFATLHRLREALGGDIVEAYLPDSHSRTTLVLRVDGRRESRESRELAVARDDIRAFADGARARLASLNSSEDGHDAAAAIARALIGGRPVQEVILAPLAGAGEPGLVLVATAAGSMRRFSSAELATFETISRTIAAHARLAHQASHDTLTDLANRRLLTRRMEAVLADDAGAVFVLIVDLDDFKVINDTFGHAVGDTVLVQFAARLSRAMGEDGIVARLGGDEFAVLVSNGEPGWRSAAARIEDCLRDPITFREQTFALRASIGVAGGREANEAFELMRNADTALYEAKRLGKSQCLQFSPPMHDRVARRYRIADDLLAAIHDEQIVVVVQPSVDLATGAIVGGEALSRWTHPVLGPIAPDEFARISEAHGLSPELARYVIARAVDVLEQCPVDISLSVNINPVDLSDARLVAELEALAAAIAPRVLGIEVTESALIADQSQIETLARLRECGLDVLIDDFGTGYSSLSYLKNVPADYLKVPKQFVEQTPGDRQSVAITRAVIAIARALGLGVIAEGVETQPQADLLVELGCDRAQGYLFSRPVPIEQFVAMVQERGVAAA